MTCAGASLINVGGDWDSTNGDFIADQSTVDLTSTGNVSVRQWHAGIDPVYPFYRLKAAAPGQTTTLLSDITTFYLEVGSGTLTDGANSYYMAIHNSVDNMFVDGGASLNLSILAFQSSTPNSTINIAGRDFTAGGGTGVEFLFFTAD